MKSFKTLPRARSRAKAPFLSCADKEAPLLIKIFAAARVIRWRFTEHKKSYLLLWLGDLQPKMRLPRHLGWHPWHTRDEEGSIQGRPSHPHYASSWRVGGRPKKEKMTNARDTLDICRSNGGHYAARRNAVPKEWASATVTRHLCVS